MNPASQSLPSRRQCLSRNTLQICGADLDAATSGHGLPRAPGGMGYDSLERLITASYS